MIVSNRTVVCAALLALFPLGAAQAVVPRPNCDNLDRAESGMSGETTAAEIASGVNKLGFTCNTQLVGGYQGEGASWQLAAWKNCAYYDQRLNPAEKNPGVVVLDVSDPSNPRPTAYLNTSTMLDPWESLKVNAARQLLGGDQHPPSAGALAPGFAIYDISKDCAHPILLSSVEFPGSWGHTGQWAPDGNTYYITPLRTSPSIVVVDTKDAANPKVIPCGAGTDNCNSQGFWVAPPPLNPIFHDLELSKDGNTAYVTMISAGAALGPGLPNGLLILDVSDFQQRRTSPAIRVIGSVSWDDGSIAAQNALPITIAGKPYILFTDEAGVQAAGCSLGKSANGFPRLIDISDPKNPKVVSKLQLDVHDPANCSKISTAQVVSTGPSGFGFSCHYCNVDDADNATIAACSCFSAGLRIFDIRDPLNPKEIAYYKPPAQGTKSLAGSQYSARAGDGFARNYDWAPSKPSFPKDRGMTSGDLWTTFQDNGFNVIRISHLTSGCNNAGATFGVVALLALMPLVQRLRRRK